MLIAELKTVANRTEQGFARPESHSYICSKVREGTGPRREKTGCYSKARYCINVEKENTEDTKREVLF